MRTSNISALAFWAQAVGWDDDHLQTLLAGLAKPYYATIFAGLVWC